MIARREVEQSYKKLLENEGVTNVRMPVERSLKKYPYVVVEMVNEDTTNAYTISTLSVECHVWSDLKKDWEKNHYKIFQKVLDALAVNRGLWTKLRDLGLNVMGVYPTLDSGTMDIMDNAGTPRVKSIAESKIVVF